MIALLAALARSNSSTAISRAQVLYLMEYATLRFASPRANRVVMRQWLGILLLAVVLVSHGGFSGAIPHADEIHSHDAESPHHAPAPSEEALEMGSLAAETSTSGETAPHASAHSHIAVGLPETASPLASYLSERSRPRPGQTSALVGSEPAPLTQPPLA